MKKRLLVCIGFLVTSYHVFSQNNVFPTPTATVGIGTSRFSSEAHLHVCSTTHYPRLSILSTHASGAPGLSLGNSSSPFRWTMHYDIANQFMGFFYEGVGNHMVISNTGRVGIGANDPKTALDISGHLRLGKLADLP